MHEMQCILASLNGTVYRERYLGTIRSSTDGSFGIESESKGNSTDMKLLQKAKRGVFIVRCLATAGRLGRRASKRVILLVRRTTKKQ